MASEQIRILLVEDDLEEIRTIWNLLHEKSKFQFQLEAVTGLTKALTYLNEHDVDIVLLDLSLISHEAETDAIKRVVEAQPHMALLVLTELENEVAGLKALEAGAQDYLLKEEMGTRTLVRALHYAVERERAAALVRAADARHRAAADSIIDYAIITLDAEGRIINWSVGATHVFGYEGAEVMGQPFELLFTPEDRAAGRPAQELATARELGGVEAERWLIRKDGSRFYGSGTTRPIRDVRGQLRGVVKIVRDATAREQLEAEVRANEKRQAFLLKLSDALRSLSDPIDIQATAVCILGEQLHASRVAYGEISADDEYVIFRQDYTDGVPSVAGQYRMADFGSSFTEMLRAGRTLVVPDVTNSPDLSDAEKAAYPSTGVAAEVGVPLMQHGRLVAIFAVHQSQVRAWTPAEVALIVETAERTWVAVKRVRAEKVLRESEARLRKAISIETVGVLFFRLDGQIHDANRAFERMSGYSREELRNTVSWEGLTPVEYMEVTLHAAGELATAGETAPYEKQMIRKDGSRWWGLFAPTRLTGSGTDTECVEYIIDITERIEAQARLRALEERRLLTVEATGVGDWDMDLVTGEIYWSPRMYTLFRVSNDVTPDFDLMLSHVHRDDQQGLLDTQGAALAGVNGGRYRVEFRVEYPGEQVRWLEGRGQVLFAKQGRAKKPVRITGTMIDITVQKQAEKAEREQRLLAETLRDTGAELASALKLDEVLERGVKAVSRVVPCDAACIVLVRDDTLTNFCSDSMSADEHAALEAWHRKYSAISDIALYRQVAESQEPVAVMRRRTLARLPAPFARFSALLAVKLVGNGAIVGFLLVLRVAKQPFSQRDSALLQSYGYQVTAALGNARRLQQVQELAALQERQQFARDLHDAVSQILFTAAVFTERLPQMVQQNPEQMPELLELVNRMIRGAHAELRSLLLELRPMNLQSTPLPELFQYLVDALQGRTQLQVRYGFKGSPELPPEVHLSVYRIVQEALNNISKHAQATSVSVEGRGGPQAIELRICDNGQGFALDKVPAGMGLQMMRERAEGIGAVLHVESRPGAGTEVHLVWAAP